MKMDWKIYKDGERDEQFSVMSSPSEPVSIPLSPVVVEDVFTHLISQWRSEVRVGSNFFFSQHTYIHTYSGNAPMNAEWMSV